MINAASYTILTTFLGICYARPDDIILNSGTMVASGLHCTMQDFHLGDKPMYGNTNELRDTASLKPNSQCPLQNRRKDDRVSVMDILYVIIDTKPQTMGQVVEISSTGMAFTFVDIDDVSKRLAQKDTLTLDLFAGGKGFFVKDVSCRLVSKIEKVSSSPAASHSINRVGVEFEGLSVPQQVQINQLVRRHNLSEV